MLSHAKTTLNLGIVGACGRGASFKAACDALGHVVAHAVCDTVRAGVRPRLPVAGFLEAYARAGGTHHSALVLGDVAEAIAAFGRLSGVEVVRLG